MEIESGEFRRILNLLKPGLSNTGDIEGTDNYIFVDDRIITYNDSISVQFPFEHSIEGMINADKLEKVVSKLKGSVSVNINDNEIIIKSGTIKSGLRIDFEIPEFLEDVYDLSEIEWEEAPEKFIEKLIFCSYSAAKETDNPLVTCVHIVDDFVEATNNLKITKCTFDKKISDECFVPANCVRQMRGFKAEEYAIDGAWIHFRNSEGCVFSCRRYKGEFLNTEKIYEIKGKKIEIPEKLKGAVERAKIFNEDEQISILITGKGIRVKGVDSLGWLTEMIKVKNDCDKIRFEIHPQSLIEIIEGHNECILSDNFIRFNGDDWVHTGFIVKES